MRHHPWTFCLGLAFLGGFVSGSPAARGSYLGFKEWQKHEHPTTFALPPLHEPAPRHVPQLSNHDLLWLREHGPPSPIWLNAQIEIQLSKAVFAHRSLNPERFDFYHPTLGHIFRNPEFFQYVLRLYNTHQARFTYYHHELIPVIRGWAMMM